MRVEVQVVGLMRPPWDRGGVAEQGRAQPVTARLSTCLRSYLQLKYPLCLNELITFPVPGTGSTRGAFGATFSPQARDRSFDYRLARTTVRSAGERNYS
jgi:hypothetical protein